MRTWGVVVSSLLAAMTTFAVVAGVKTFMNGSRQAQVAPAPPLALDSAAAAARLAEAVRIETISWDDRPDASADAFLALHALLERAYPNAHRVLKREKVANYSLLYTWPGADPSLKPVMLMAHQDVVPIAPGTEKDWLHPPFSGAVADGFVWGRGAWDDKSNLLGVFEAVEMLAASGAQPRRTLYIASGHDEEVGGQRGAAAIARLLESRNVSLEFVLDEGMIVTQGVAPGLKGPLALIGVAEKGYATFALSTSAAPGHSSMPPPRTVIGRTAEAAVRVEMNPPPAHLSGVPRETFETIAPEMPLTNRVLLSNLWLTEPLVRRELARQPASNAMLRTTAALTMFNAGSKSNVLPGHAQALINFRILQGDSVANLKAYLERTIRDPGVKVELFGDAREPTPVSPVDSPAYKLINRTIRETMPDAIVAPGLVIAGTDSRNMGNLSANIYRFLPIRAKPEDLARFHGTNERVSVKNYAETIGFFHRLLSVSVVAGG